MRVGRVTAGRAGATAADVRAAELFAAEVTEYLQRTPRQLPSKYFYDDLGSALFEAICRLPWYRVTRAETRLLATHAREILRPLARPLSFAELGCGSGEKLALFAANSGEGPLPVQLIDVSQAALDMASHRLQADGFTSIVTHKATYQDGLVRAATSRPAHGAMLVLFLGSNIGNFDPPVADAMLRAFRERLRAGDALLLGADLVKPEADLLLAYDDPLKVTAAFNRNLLRRINDELGGTFDLDGFIHRAVWRPVERRVEMHLVSVRPQVVRIAATGLEVSFERDEPIWTESSHKYEAAQVVEMGEAAGFRASGQWIDERAQFALTRFLVQGG
jgi:dimethylhistidine N-methyltransferase